MFKVVSVYDHSKVFNVYDINFHMASANPEIQFCMWNADEEVWMVDNAAYYVPLESIVDKRSFWNNDVIQTIDKYKEESEDCCQSNQERLEEERKRNKELKEQLTRFNPDISNAEPGGPYMTCCCGMEEVAKDLDFIFGQRKRIDGIKEVL